MEDRSNKIVSVIIATCAAQDYLKHCLESLKAQTRPAQETIVIDNSLNPDFNQKITQGYPYVKLYVSPKQLSYCESLNKGISISRGDFILCLNDDVILDPRFIEEALGAFWRDDKVGMTSGKILRSDRQTIDSAGLILSVFRTAKERGYGIKDKGKFEKDGFIFGVTGAAAFYRRDMLEDIKEDQDYFDPDFHFFYEDLDMAWRAKRAGWVGYYMPGAVAYHVRGGSVRKNTGINKSYARRYLDDDLHLDLIKNRYLTIIKNESCAGFIGHLPFYLFYDFVVWSYILLFRPHLIKDFFFRIKFLKAAFKKRVSSVDKSDKSKLSGNQKILDNAHIL